MNLLSQFESALGYGDFLAKYGTPEQQRRWQDFHASVQLTDAQQQLLGSFTREMNVLVFAGAWCGDCVNQCPIFDHFAAANDCVRVRFLDRDDSGPLMQKFTTCGGARVPSVVFLAEDGEICGRYGDRTLAKYRSMMSSLSGAACPTGLGHDQSLTEQVIQEWLDEFERIQWMLRTSSRLREKHGD